MNADPCGSGSTAIVYLLALFVESRIKRVARHKAFWHIKKLNKAQDEPLTEENKTFVQDFIDKKYTGPLKQVPTSYHTV